MGRYRLPVHMGLFLPLETNVGGLQKYSKKSEKEAFTLMGRSADEMRNG